MAIFKEKTWNRTKEFEASTAAILLLYRAIIVTKAC